MSRQRFGLGGKILPDMADRLPKHKQPRLPAQWPPAPSTSRAAAPVSLPDCSRARSRSPEQPRRLSESRLTIGAAALLPFDPASAPLAVHITTDRTARRVLLPPQAGGTITDGRFTDMSVPMFEALARGWATVGDRPSLAHSLATSDVGRAEGKTAATVYAMYPAAARYTIWQLFSCHFMEQALWLTAAPLSATAATRLQAMEPHRVDSFVDQWTYAVGPISRDAATPLAQPLYFNYSRLPAPVPASVPIAPSEARIYLRLATAGRPGPPAAAAHHATRAVSARV